MRTLTNTLEQYVVHHVNSEEYHHLKREIFGQHLYYIELDSPTPLVIDAGAHIGLATLYFKKLYPMARITAVEPNPETFAILKENVSENRLDDVTLIEAALVGSVPTPPTVSMYRDRTPEQWWSTAGFVKGAWTGGQKSEVISVPAVDLKSIIGDQQVDVLKMDIEGAEQQVLRGALGALRNVKHIFIEFHPHQGQNLEVLVEFLSEIFDVVVKKRGNAIDVKKSSGLVMIEGANKTLVVQED